MSTRESMSEPMPPFLMTAPVRVVMPELQRELAAERAGRSGKLEAVGSDDSETKGKAKADKSNKPGSVEPIISP